MRMGPAGKNDVDRQDEGPATMMGATTSALKPGRGVSGLDAHLRKIISAVTWRVAGELAWIKGEELAVTILCIEDKICRCRTQSSLFLSCLLDQEGNWTDKGD